jgi:hypothetical protein
MHFSSIDYIASGELGPIQHVSGSRLRRHLTLNNGTYAGAIYACATEPIGPNSDKIARSALDSVVFTIAPYERNHLNRDLTSWGPQQFASVPRYGRRWDDGASVERGDHELWNNAASQLYAASDSLTLSYGRVPSHFVKGTWQAGYVGNPGRDTVWSDCRAISHGIIPCEISSPAHFNARHKSGTVLRIVARWEPLTHGGCERRLAIMKVRGDAVRVPKYLTRWIETRLR